MGTAALEGVAGSVPLEAGDAVARPLEPRSPGAESAYKGPAPARRQRPVPERQPAESLLNTDPSRVPRSIVQTHHWQTRPSAANAGRDLESWSREKKSSASYRLFAAVQPETMSCESACISRIRRPGARLVPGIQITHNCVYSTRLREHRPRARLGVSSRWHRQGALQ